LRAQDADRTARGVWARGGGAGSLELGFRGGSSPELANLGPPGWNPSGKRVRAARLSMSDPPRVTVGFVGALCGKSTGDGGNRAPVVVDPVVGEATTCGN
jgi:hypothetical protein